MDQIWSEKIIHRIRVYQRSFVVLTRSIILLLHNAVLDTSGVRYDASSDRYNLNLYLKHTNTATPP